MILVAAMLLVSSPVASAPSLLQVVDRYVTWRGGERFQALRSIRMTETIGTGGLNGTEEETATSGGKVRLDTVLGPLKQTQVMTPDQTWELTPSGQIQSMASADVASIDRETELLFPDTIRGSHGTKLVLAAPTSFRGRAWATLRVTFGDDDIYDMLIDPVSGELGGLRIVEERQERIEGLDDWRDVDGIRMPFRKTTKSAVPSDDATEQVTAIAMNQPIDESMFLRPTPVPKTTFRNGANSTGWIPFELYAGNRIFIPGRINGRDTAILLDSGASVSTVDSDYAATLGLDPVGRISAGGSGGIGTAGFSGGVDVRIADLAIPNLTVASIDLSPIAKRIGHAIPFVLGDEVFNELVVDIDFKRHRIAFRKPDSIVVPKNARAIPLHRLIGNRSVPVSIEGQPPIECEFDLGNGSPLDLYPAYYQTHGTLSQRRTSKVLAGAVGGFHPETVASLDRVGFGGVTFTNVPTNFTRDVASAANSNLVVGNIGLPMLARFRLLIDYAHDRLFALPITGASAVSFRRDRLGLAMTAGSRGVSVDFVSPGSPAELAGFKASDVIAAIDGKPASAWTDSAIAALRYTTDRVMITFAMADRSRRSVKLRDFF